MIQRVPDMSPRPTEHAAPQSAPHPLPISSRVHQPCFTSLPLPVHTSLRPRARANSHQHQPSRATREPEPADTSHIIAYPRAGSSSAPCCPSIGHLAFGISISINLHPKYLANRLRSLVPGLPASYPCTPSPVERCSLYFNG